MLGGTFDDQSIQTEHLLARDRNPRSASRALFLYGMETACDPVIGEGVRRHPVLWSCVGSVLLAAVLGLTLGKVFRDEEAHLASHLTLAVPAWLLFASSLRLWPPPRTDRYSRIARYGLLIAIAASATGASLEAVGAIGFEDMLGIPVLAGFHPVGVAIGGAGMALALSAVGVNLIVWGAARAGKLKAVWMPYAMAVAGVGGLAFILGALVFGY